MARVYSWQINESPKTYAYIVNPNNTETAYIGYELTGANLQKVIDWASTCTDTQYESQFDKVKALCKSSGYEVTFETVETYMNVRSSCDNLRGPSGRSIRDITLMKVDSSTKTDTYAINYDDGTYDTFTVQNGRDGINGNDGKPGTQGDTGVSYRTIMAYTSGVNADGEEIKVLTPQGGKYDFDNNITEYPEGWQASDNNPKKLTPPIWMSSRTFASLDSLTDTEWAPPIQITGDNGEPGVDGITTEFIYKLSNTTLTEAPPSVDKNDDTPAGWEDNPKGVDETNQKEWYCLRRKINKKWGDWMGPFIWSQYGVNGQDGDGVQYIYMKTKTGQPPANPTPNNWLTDTGPKGYQDKDYEWIPPLSYTDTNGDKITLTPEMDGDTTAGIWEDNPIPVTIKYQYQWVSTRKYRMSEDGKTKIWKEYSNPALWNKFGEDGKSGTVIRKLYALSEDTSNPPDLPNSTSFTGDWGTGFPRDYKSEKNVVWGTEAEIDIATNEFVMGYKKISITNKDGAVIVPSGANEKNTEEVDVLPDKKIGKQYVRLKSNGHYYEWSGGWCDPYLVTGVMGKPGDPISYNTYYFHYGSADSVPDKPTRTDVNASEKEFEDYKTKKIWEDFPKTSIWIEGKEEIRIDNETNRWYQCCGLVNKDQIVEKWGSVYPCNAKDGETLPGVYIEMRFGTGLDDIPPTLNIDMSKPEEIRNPKLYDVNNNECGWYTTSHQLLVPSGGHVYEIWAKIDSATNTVIPEGDVYWNGPIRISGEKGEQGIPGPAGLKGISGIPGVSINSVFVLGTSTKYFAKKRGAKKEDGTENEPENDNANEPENDNANEPKNDNASKEEMIGLGWFDNKNIPYSDCIDMQDKIAVNDLKDGRVIRLHETSSSTSYEGDVTTTRTYYYYHTSLNDEENYPINESGEIEGLGLIKTEIDGLYQIKDFNDETDGIYIWCVQGDDVWVLGNEYGYVKVEGIIADSDNTIELKDLPQKENDYRDFSGKLYKYGVYNGYCYEWNKRGNTSVAVPATIMLDKDILRVTEIPTKEKTGYDYILKYIKLENGDEIKENYYKWAALDGADVKYKKATVDWGEPFRLQGTNGLRGLTGHRGQVVYPMGIYNHNEVYRTTAEKAPYVYDPEDGMFYVYNITTLPWVGHWPTDYETIMIHPDGVNVNNTHTLEEGKPFPETTQQGNKPYLYDKYGASGIKAYYKWIDGKYVRVSKYKYSRSGNATDDWIPQQEQTPSTNYANATNNNLTPAWVRFESFEALYTSIGIIENGIIGSAVYNNEFMFSQQGIDRDGNESNYAKGGMGFLDGYEYDNTVKKWKYKDGPYIDNNADVNPYEIGGVNGKTPIHSFRPNVCINFATGQMWTACGKCFHNYDGTGHLADQAIKWWWLKNEEEKEEKEEKEGEEKKEKEEQQICVQIGYDGQNGIIFTPKEFKIGLLDKLEEDTLGRFEAMADDGYISPEERKALKKEKEVIQSEHNAIQTQAENYGFKESETYRPKYENFIEKYNGSKDEDGKVITASLLDVIDYYTDATNAINDKTNIYYGFIQIHSGDNLDVPKSNYSIITDYYQAKDDLLEAFTEYEKETINKTASEFLVGIEGITSAVKRISVENLLNGTAFNTYNISNANDKKNTVFICETYGTGGGYTIGKDDPKLNGNNYVSLDTKNASITTVNDIERIYIDIYQILNEKNASQTFWKIKSGVEYTLHCKYRTTVDTDKFEYKYILNKYDVYNPGALFISGTKAEFIEVNGNEKEGSYSQDVQAYLEDTKGAWKDMVIKFTTGDIENDEYRLNAFYIRALICSKVDIALLKLEEGHTPTPWRETQGDVSSMIKQTADSITSTVEEKAEGLKSDIKQTADRISLSVDSVKSGLAKTGIDINAGTIDINAKKITFGDGDYFKESVKIENGKFIAHDATFENIVIKGSLASPFVLDKDDGKIDIYHDNYAYNIQPGSALQTYSKNLKWTPDQSGRKVTITNYKWNGNESQGDINLTIPGVFNIKEYNGWERKEDYRSALKQIYEVYSYKSYIPVVRAPFYGRQTHIKITIPKNETDFTVRIRYYTDPYKSDYTGPFYIIIYKINENVPDDDDIAQKPTKHENIREVINKVGEYDIKFTNIPNNNTEKFINIAVRQTEMSSDFSYECQIWLRKDKADEQFYYENGIKKTHLVLKQNELINLIGYGDNNNPDGGDGDDKKGNFYGWIVENRALISDTNTLYGQPFKYLASGAIRTTMGKVNGTQTIVIDKEASHVETYDGSNVSIKVFPTGIFQITFDDSWLNTISNCIVMATGYGKVLDNEGKPGEGLCKATVMPFTPFIVGEVSASIEIWVSDDASSNHGAFDFIMFNYKQMPSARIM